MFEWILSSSVLIGIMIGVRAVFKGRLRLSLQYGLWALVLVRLLIPFSLGETVISVANWTARLAEQPAVREIIDISGTSIPVQSYEEAYEQVLEEYTSQGIHAEALQDSQLLEIRQEARERSGGRPLRFYLHRAAVLLWVLGIGAVAAVFLLANGRFGAGLRRSRADTGLRQGKLPVYSASGLDTPCLFGILRPAIYVTEDILKDPTLLRHTLVHEATHHRHGDHLWAILRGLCVALHWYNPLVWWAAFLSQRDGELACDEATIRLLGERERAEYGRTLISMTCRKKSNVLLTATTMTTGKGSLRERILLIVKKPKMALYSLVAVLLIAAIAVGCTFTGSRPEEKKELDPAADALVDAYFQEYFQNGEYIGNAGEYALGTRDSGSPALILCRYSYDDGQVQVLNWVQTQYKRSSGNRRSSVFTVNHLALEEGHLYFGALEDLKDLWETLAFTDTEGGTRQLTIKGSAGYLVILDAPLADFRVLTASGTEAMDLAGFLKANEIGQIASLPPVEETSPTEPKPTAPRPTEPKPTEPLPTEPPYLAPPERVPQEADPPAAAHGLPGVGTLYEQPNDTKLCIIVTPVGLSRSGEPLYLIPENQDALWSAFEAAMQYRRKTDSLEPETEAGFAITYQGERWNFKTNGALDWFGQRVEPEYTEELFSLVQEAVRASGLQEPLRPEQVDRLQSATLQWNGTHTVTDRYALDKLEAWLRGSEALPGASACPFTALLTLEFAGGGTKTIAMGTDSCTTWFSEGVFYDYTPDQEDGSMGNEVFYALFAPELIHDTVYGQPEELTRYTVYMDWHCYEQRYGRDETLRLISTLKAWFLENISQAPAAFYAMNGLEGAYAEAYAAMLAELAEAGGKDFAWQLLGNAPEQLEAEILQMLANHWEIPVEEARAKLEAKLN